MTVTPAMIAVALGRDSGPSTAEAEQWGLWIAEATMLIAARVEYLGYVGTIPEERSDYVIRHAVVDHVRRPDNATQVTVSVTDATTSRTYRSGTGRVTISDADWTLLGLANQAGGAYAVDTTTPGSVHAATCALNFGATYCSCGADLTNYAYPLFGAIDGDYYYGPSVLL